MKDKPSQEIKYQQFVSVIEEFKKESDRAAVILIAAIFEDKLRTLLKSRLVPEPGNQDNLFDGINAPIGDFSSKINLAFRLWLISSKLSRDLHAIRKIRNSFAHDISGCSFNQASIKDQVIELSKSCSNMLPFYEQLIEEEHPHVEEGIRGVFLFISSLIVIQFIHLLDNISSYEPLEVTKNEEPYKNGTVLAAARIKAKEQKKKKKKKKK